jgi:di/tripeptidase
VEATKLSKAYQIEVLQGHVFMVMPALPIGVCLVTPVAVGEVRDPSIYRGIGKE